MTTPEISYGATTDCAADGLSDQLPSEGEREYAALTADEIETLAHDWLLSVDDVTAAADTAHKLMNYTGENGGLDTVWVESLMTDADKRPFWALMDVYYNYNIEWAGYWSTLQYGNNHDLIHALADGALVIEEDCKADNISFSASVDLDKISNDALADGIFNYIENINHDGQSRDIMSPKELEQGLEAVLNVPDDATGYTLFSSDDYFEAKELFASWSISDEDQRFRRADIRAMFNTNYFERRGDETWISYSVTSHVHHEPDFWRGAWADLDYFDNWERQQSVGAIKAILNNAADKTVFEVFMDDGDDYYNDSQEEQVKYETALSEIMGSIYVKGLLGAPTVQDSLELFADRIVFNTEMTDYGIYLGEELRTKAIDEQDLISAAILFRAASKADGEMVEYIEGQAANLLALEQVDPDEAFAELASEYMQHMVATTWADTGGAPSPDDLMSDQPVAVESDSKPAVRSLTRTAAATASSGLLDSDNLAAWLEDQDGAYRFDYSAEAVFNYNQNSARSGTSNFAAAVFPSDSTARTSGGTADPKVYLNDMFQLRMFFTHPVKDSTTGRYEFQFRIRLFDEVGITGNAKEPEVGGVSATVGSQNYHDLQFFISVDSSWGDATLEEMLWANEYNLVVEGDVSIDTTANSALSAAVSAWNTVLPAVETIPSQSAFSAWYSAGTHLTAVVAPANIKKDGDMELGAGYGIGFKYDLDVLSEADKAWVVALWAAGGALAGILVGATELWFYPEGLTSASQRHAMVAGAHFGAVIGEISGDYAAMALASDVGTEETPGVSMVHGGFVWIALRPLKLSATKALYLRSRYQLNYQFSEGDILETGV